MGGAGGGSGGGAKDKHRTRERRINYKSKWNLLTEFESIECDREDDVALYGERERKREGMTVTVTGGSEEFF